MAVYFYEQYFADCPKRPRTLLDKFISTPKNLHEMTVEEINAYTATWNPFTFGTAAKMKRELKAYLEYLQDKGLDVDPEICTDITMPIKANEYLIYSTNDIRKYWQILFEGMEKHADKIGKKFSQESYYVCIAAGILSFYGLTTGEIFELPKRSVTTEGVTGYNLPLTQDDINDLMRYRNLDRMSNNIPLCGDMYIRSGKSQHRPIPRDFLTTNLRRSNNVGEEYKYLKPYLTDTYLYKMGLFDRAFQYERDNNLAVEFKRNTPAWFVEIMRTDTPDVILKLKKEYIEYRAERRIVESTKTKKPNLVITSASPKAELERQLAEIYADINKLKEQAQLVCDKIAALK